MLRIALLAVSLALLAPQVSFAQSIEGVWRLVEREVQGGSNPRMESGSLIQPGLFILTEGHFAYLIDNGTEHRSAVQEATDAQIVESISPLAFAAGTYQFDGSTLRYVRVTAINPLAILPENQPQVRQVERLTANRLETSATNASGVKTILKYNRVE
jgi:hypothetical protein